MWGELSSQLRIALAVFFSGWAIKLLDDFLDRDLDRIIGQPNLCERLGDGLPAYLGLLLVLAVYLAPATGVTLFLSAYAAGMGNELRECYWGGWPAWLETVMAVVLGLGIAAQQFLLNLLLMVVIQLADDLHDESRDRVGGRHNWGRWLGWWPSRVVLGLAGALAVLLAPVYSGMVLASAWLVARWAEGVSANGLAVSDYSGDRPRPRISVGERGRTP